MKERVGRKEEESQKGSENEEESDSEEINEEDIVETVDSTTEELTEIMNLQDLLLTESPRPMITLVVNGKRITFLCDTGACRTTCREWIPGARPSHERVTVRSANGELTSVAQSLPVNIRDEQGKDCCIPVLLYPGCPVNLLGRDAMVKLEIALVPDLTGAMQVKRRKDLLDGDIFVLQGSGSPRYFYSFDLTPGPPYCISEGLLKTARQTLTHPQREMSKDDLHITMWFKQTPGPDEEYWQDMQRRPHTKITIDYLYTDNLSSSVATVKFANPDVVDKLYFGYTTPHISLFKETHQTWESLGRVAQMGQRATDWEEVEHKKWVSKSTGLTRISLFWHASVKAEVHLHTQEAIRA